MMLLVAILLLATLASADDSSGVCSRSCTLEESTAKYEAGMQYQYQYQGEVSTKALVAGEDESRMAITAEVVITANTPCDLKLQVATLVVEDANDDSKWFSEAVLEHDLHFSYQRGAITHLCPHEEEEAVATNFKRGILSSLQMTVTPRNNQSDVIVSEIDVSGQCDTKYSMVLEPNLQVTKTKMGCHTSSYIPHLPHSHYTNTKANTQLPFAKSNHICQMHGKGGTTPRGDIDATGGGGMWEKVECTEEVQVHRPLTPGSNESSLATVTVSSKLTLEDGPTPMDGNFLQGEELKKRVSLVADLKAAVEFAEMKKLSGQSVKNQVDSVLESLAESENPEQDEVRPRLFSTLVQLLGHLDEVELDTVWESSSSQSIHRRMLVDGLLVCDGSLCHALVARLAEEQGTLSPGQLNMWLTGLHLHSSTNPVFIRKLLDLAESQEKAAAAAVMAASSVVHQLCQQQPSECLSHVQPFLEYLDQQVGVSCGLGKTRQQQEHVKLALRAMGNAGVFPSDHFPERCYLNRDLPPELRITALQSYRRTSCSGVEAPWKLLEDVNERSEVRVAAYLALVPCAAHTSGFFTRIHKLLQQEEVHQVYSFIWTHVKNLADHPGPSKHDQEISKLARQHTLPHKFNSDAFRSSGNFRYAHFSEMLNSGGSMDANIIYSQDSYVPQQVSANLTLDILDNSFNFLDFGGEFSGIESIIESYFGENGYFANEDILKVLQNLRPKRNLIHDDKIQEFQKMYNEAKDKRKLDSEKDDTIEEEAKTSFYVRMFGNEILHVENLLQDKYNPAQLLYRLAQELSSPKTFKILDQEYMTPTLLGFPLRLKINATASVNLQHEHTFHNTRKLGLLLEGSLTPSVVAAMDETLLVDAFVSSSGLRRSSTQVAKTTIGGKFSVQNSEVVELQVSIPDSEVTKVSSFVKVALLKGVGRWEEPEANSIQGEDHCIDAIEEVVGLRVCTSHSYGLYEVDGKSIIADPSKVEFKVTRTDTFNYYKLYVKQQENMIEALFDTPGSTIDRKIHFLINMNPDHESGYIVIRGAGYGIKGQYKYSDMSSELKLQYLQASKVLGELEVSLKKQKEGLSQEYVPKFLVAMGPDKFTLEGKLMHTTDEDMKKLEASWEVEGAWHKMESNMVTQAFGTASGNFLVSQDEFNLHLKTEYGSEPSQPHFIILTLFNSHTLHREMKTVTGAATLQISQISAGLTVAYECRPDLFELSTSASLQTTKVSSQVVVKNVMHRGTQDTQLTLSLASEELDIDYKASGIYKVAESGFQAEAELNFDSSFKSKFLLTYLFEDDPMHILAGLHLTLNDFVFQVGHNIDMTQPEHLLITASTTIGEGTAGLYFEADYRSEHPFNASLEVFADMGTQSFGLSSHTTSDLQWQNFTGKSTVKWLDWSGSLTHEIVFNETTKALKLSLESGESFELLFETSPNQTVKVVVRDGTGDSTPIFMMGAEKHISSEHSMLQMNLTAGDSHLVHLGWHMNSENQFNFSLHLLESMLNMDGQYSVMDNGTTSGDMQAKIVLPSGDVISSDLNLSYVKMENEYLLVVSASHEDSTIEGQLLVNHGGRFDAEKSGINFTLTTPHPHFQKFGFAFHKSAGAHSLYSAMIELDNFKILGDAQLNDPSKLLFKLEYEGGEECASRLHLEHSHSEQQYLSIASLALTQASEPWELVLNTSLDHSSHQHFLDTRFSVQAPVMFHPFHFHGMYNVTENQVQLEIQTGLEKSISVLYHGKKELSWKRHLLSGLGKIEASWMEPLSVNITYDHTLGGLNINVDCESEGDYVTSWNAEFSSEYSSTENIKASFFLTYSELQITMEFVHNQSENNWKQQLEGSINTFTVTYNTNLKWNEYFIPTNAEGSLSLFNFLDHSLDLSLSHTKESSTYTTHIDGTFDDYIFDLEHKLAPEESQEGWQDYLQVTLRNVGVTTGDISLTANTHGDWPAVNSSLKFESPWTDSFGANFVLQEVNSSSSVILESFYGDKSLLSADIVCGCWPSWEKSYLVLKATSAFFEDFKLKLQHDFNSGNLVFGEVAYGSDVHMQLGSHLKIKETWFEQEFQSYAFNATASIMKFNINFKSMGTIDSHFNGTLKLHWNENSLSLNSSVLSGNIFEAEVRTSGTNYQSKLKYELENESLFSLNFTLLKDMQNFVFLQSIVESVYPKLDAVSTLEFFTDQTSKTHGKILVTADLTNIDKYSLQGNLEVESNLFTLKEYGGLLDINLNFDNKHNWKGLVEVAVHGGDWNIRSGVNTSLEVSQAVSFEFGAKLHRLYGSQTYDLKDVSAFVSVESDGAYEMRMILQPNHTGTPWSLAVIYNHRYGTLKGFLSLGDSRKYELSLRLSSRTLTVDAHQVNDDDSKWQIVEGNINWILKRTKQLITMNMKSDIPSISKITGKIIIQRKRDLAVTATLKVNDAQFHGNFRLRTLEPGRSFRVDIKVDNNIIKVFESEVAVEFTYAQSGFTCNLKIGLNQKPDWIEGNLKFSVPESYLKLRTPLSFLETFNTTVRTKIRESYGFEMVIETPQFCWNLTGNLDRTFLHASLNLNLDLLCDKDSFFDFKLQYDISKNPIGILCELHVIEYGLLFKFNTSGNLTTANIDLQVETEVYPQHALGVSLACEVGQQNSLRLHAYDPPSNGTYFSFEIFLLPSKAKLTVELPKGQSFLIKANYDFQNQPKKLNSSITSSLFDYDLNAKIDGEASLGGEEGNIELTFTSNTVFTHLNISGTYSFLEELKDLSFKILTPNGDVDGEVRVLQDKDFLSVKADMTSSLHTFHKYHLEVSQTTEDAVEKLTAMIAQDDFEYHLNSLKKIIDEGTERNLNVSLPFEGCEHFRLDYIWPNDSSYGTYQGNLNVKSYGETYVVETNSDLNNSVYQLLFNWTASEDECMGTIKYSTLSSGHQIETMLNIPEMEGKPVSVVLKYSQDGIASAVFYSPHGHLGAEGSLIFTETTIVLSATVHLSLFHFGEINLDMTIPLQMSEHGEIKMMWIFPDWTMEMWLYIGEHLKTGGVGLLIRLDGESKTYSLSYDIKDALRLEGQFEELNLETTWVLKGPQTPASAGQFEVRSNFPGYEAIDGSWEVGYKNWQYYGQATLDVKHQEVLSVSTTLDTLSEGASYPWQNVRLNMLLESPFTSPHHLHAEYQLLTPQMLLYYQHGLDTFKIQLKSDFSRNSASLVLTGNIPVEGISFFDVNVAYNFFDSNSASVVVKVEDSTLEHKFDFSSDWRVGSVQLVFTSPFLKPGNAQLSWSLVPNSVILKGFFKLGELSGKVKMSLENTKSSANFDCHITTSVKELSQFIISLSYKVSGNNNFDVSLAARMNNNGLLVKSSFDTKGGKLLLKFQGTFEILGSRGSLEVDVGPNGDGYSGSVVGKFPEYKKFFIDLYFDSYQLKLNSMYDAKEVFVISVNYDQAKIHIYWTEYWSLNLTTRLLSKGRKYLFRMMFSGFGIDPIELEASYSQRQSHLLKLSLTSSLLPPSTLQVTYSGNKVTVRGTIGEKIYIMSGRANLRRLQSSFDIRFESSDEPDNPIVMKIEYDLTDFFVGRMKTAKKLAQITLEWEEKLQVNVTGLRSSNMAKIDLKAKTPLKILPHLHLGFHGEFFFTEFVGFNCTAFVEWSERVKVTAIAKLMQANVNIECALMTSFASLEKLSASLKLEPGQLQLSAQYNDDTWKAVWDYQFTPFSVTCSVETPVTNFEMASFSISIKTDNEKIGAEFELMWPDNQKLGVQIEVEKWQVELNFQTPWEPFTAGLFTMSLKTEGEELTLSSVLQLDRHEAEVSLVLLLTNFKFLASYSENLVTVGIAKLEYSQREGNMRLSLGIQTPFKNLESLEASLQHGDNKISLMFKINEVMNVIEGMYSANGGEFRANIPLLSNLSWLLRAENTWLKAETNVALITADNSEPLIASLKYDIEPGANTFRSMFSVVHDKELMSVDVEYGQGLSFMAKIMNYSFAIQVSPTSKENSVKLKLETPELSLESLVINLSVKYEDRFPFHLETILLMSVKHLGEEPNMYKIQGSYLGEMDPLVNIKLEGNDLPTYEVNIKIQRSDIGLEIVMTGDGKEMFALQYSSGSQNHLLLPQKLMVQTPAWEAKGHLLLTITSLTASLTLPQSSEHSLIVKWPEQLALENFKITAELRSPYIPQEVLKLIFTCSVPENFHGKMELDIVFGGNDMHVSGEYKYDEAFKTFQTKFQIASNLVSDYSFLTNVQWRRNIHVTASLEALEEEHSLVLHIDATNSAIELMLKSPLLSVKEITFTGELSTPLNLSHMTFRSKLQTDDQEVELEARLESDQLNQIDSYAVLRKNNQDIFSVSLKMFEDTSRTDFDLSMDLLLDKLENSVNVRYYDADWGRYLSGFLKSHMFTEDVKLTVINTHELSDLQSLSISGPSFNFFAESNINSRSGQVSARLGYDEIDFLVSGDIFENKRIGIQLKSTFVNYEVLSFYAIWSVPGKQEIGVEYAGNGEIIMLNGILWADDLFGYSIDVTLKTSFEGYEKFSLVTPQYKSSKQTKALLEYPGRKVGVDVNLNYKDIFFSDFTISLYLPYEEFEIISLKYVTNSYDRFEVEARIGKIGFTSSSLIEKLISGMRIEVVIRLNEHYRKSVLYTTYATSKRMTARYSFVSEPKELRDRHSLHGKIFYEVNDRIFLIARDNKEEWVKVHIAWGAEKILTLVTPKFLPGYVHLNLECGSLRDDYRFEFGLLTADMGAWSVYGLQLHKEVLPWGHHLSVLGHSGGYLVNIAGTLSASPNHFNNSLVFALNKNKMGYKTVLLRESCLLSRRYTSDIQLLLHNRTLHHHTQATATIKSVNLMSNFTWNKKDEHMPPITFSMNYDDKFFFGNGKKYLSAVLSHPDIKDITLLANITRTNSSSLHGLAELVDGNSPEMKVVATMEVEPVRDDGRQTVSLSLSQPVSNFSMLMEAQLRQDPLTEALCKLKYYSLISETWHQVNLSASLESQASGHALTVAMVAQEKEWGHTWRGALDSKPEEASLSLEGSSLELGDTWKLGSVVKRHVPELLMYLSVGKELEVYEEARVRLGLHSPVEVGAAVDHLRFGEWHQDVALGLRLTSPHVLQAFLDFDPSLDYKDYQDWAHMFSPTMEVLDVWKRDMTTAIQNLNQWAATEVPAAMKVLLNNGTIQAIWQREASNWDYFLKDMEDTYQGIAEDVKTLWESVLIPVFEALRDYSIQMYESARSYLASLKDSVQNFLEEALQWLQDAWESFQTKFSLLEASLMGQLVEWWDSVGQGASTLWTDLLRFGETLSAEVTNFLEEAKKFFIMLGETMKGYLNDTFQAIQPYFEGLPQAFQSYGQEVLAEFSGPCWMAITDKMDNLAALSQDLDSSMRVVTEFLQVEKYYPLLLKASNWLKDKFVSVWSSIKETMIQAGQDLLQAFRSWSPPLTEFVRKVWDFFSQLPTQMATEGLYPLVVSMIGDLQKKVSEMALQLPMLLRESIEPLHSYLTQFHIFEQIDGAIMGIYDWAQAAWERWSSGQHTNLGFMEQQLFLLGDAIRDYLTTTNHLLNQIFVFEPSVLGYVVYNQYLPGHWTSFMELPSWTLPSHLFHMESAATEAERMMAAALPNPSLIQALMPSYTATAVIAGQHVTTFDLHHYQYLGSCSYLLAKDFEGGDFEVFGVYETEAGATRLRSVVVHSQNTDVTLSVDGSVTSMGNGAEVHNSTDYSALKLPDLFVSCSRALRGCALTVSVKYFGRLGGLLGNYNGDASDDMHGPDGQVAQNAAQLATQWAISPTPCYQANQANVVEDYNDVEEEDVRECSRLFLYGNSPLSDCFHAIDPVSYFMHCIQGHTHPAFSEHDLNSPCTTVSSYRTQCWARHIHLPDLDKCKNGNSTGCVVEGKEVPYGWNQVFEETSHGLADVAFIVELADCNAGRDMASLLDYLTRQLERNNINDVRYSVVAVSEDDVITKSFLTKRNTTDFLNTLTFSGVTAVENIEAVVASTASELEWRPGVSRSIVHVGCQACKQGDEATKALHQNDVTYHLVSSLVVEMAGTNKEAQARKRKLFGFDENLVYTPADFKNYKGSEKLRLALRSPKGGCVATALSTGGSVFDSNKWTPKKAIQTKKFLNVLAKRVEASSSPPKCQECHCLKEDSRTVPTCFKCFGNSVFLITEVGNGASDAAKENSVTNDIKRSFQEDFLKSDSNTTMLRRIL